MSHTTSFSSADFPAVPPELDVGLPDRLNHKDVLRTHAQAFSTERCHPVAVVDLPSRAISMTIGALAPSQATRMHRHNYETLIYVTKGSGESVVGSRTVKWQAGDAIYVPVWSWHQHINTGNEDVVYVACENAPMLQNLGVALRQEK
ncbi:cupin domain-containing protein [Paraburkholderia dilworthii]|uniref:cupin domain-containing protein n=1 Tax=Paraburkholderia dilworthii TaxID=948106 RepID=UPI001ADEC4C7|nr:cupin domain-containing protein [Paraburkholderia dilworthii]